MRILKIVFVILFLLLAVPTFLIAVLMPRSDRYYGESFSTFVAPLPGRLFQIKQAGYNKVVIEPITQTSTDKTRTSFIPAPVVEIGVNDVWLIAKQQLMKLVHPENPKDTSQVPDNGNYAYWILNMQTDTLLGPLSEADFNNRREKLGVPLRLQMQNARNFRL